LCFAACFLLLSLIMGDRFDHSADSESVELKLPKVDPDKKKPVRSCYALLLKADGTLEEQSREKVTNTITSSQASPALMIPSTLNGCEFILVSKETMEKKPERLCSDFPMIQTMLEDEMNNMQNELRSRINRIKIDKFVSTAPEHEVYRLWMKKKQDAKGGSDDRFFIFNSEWKDQFGSQCKKHLESMNSLLTPITLEQWPEFFKRMHALNFAHRELDVLDNHMLFLRKLTEELDKRQEIYDKIKTEVVPAFASTRKVVTADDVEKRKEFIEYIKKWEESGMEFNEDALEFLKAPLSAEDEPLKFYDPTFTLPPNRLFERLGKFASQSRSRLNKTFDAAKAAHDSKDSELQTYKDILETV